MVESDLVLRYELKGDALTVAGQEGVMTFQRASPEMAIGLNSMARSAAAKQIRTRT